MGVIKGQEKVADHKFKITSKKMVNDFTATFTFTALNSLAKGAGRLSPKVTDPASLGPQNLKRWYNDPSMIGRHFLVYSA